MHWLTHKLEFPDPSKATSDGLLALGGDLSSERLMLAYESGIFPWYENDQPILWWCPDPRMVLFPENFKVSKSLQKSIRLEDYKITYNTAFSEVIKNCAVIKRNGQKGTWITEDMQQAYLELYELGHIISVEVWKDDILIGGLYGVDLPEQKVFCGESMFSLEKDASKIGFYNLVNRLKKENYRLIDCQVYTSHMESLGAEEISRDAFVQFLGR